MPEPVTTSPLLTDRLRLRAFRVEDAADLYAYLSDPRVYRFEPGAPLDQEGAQRTAQEFAADPNFWAVELLIESRVIGQIYFAQQEPSRLLTWELGYILSPAYQRQGYASEAAAALVDYGFRCLGVYRVIAHCNPQNLASWKLLEKLGFRREAHHLRDNFFHRDANGSPIWNDTYVYALLAEDRAVSPN